MASPFNGKQILNAYYTNEAHDTILVIYNDNDDWSIEPARTTMYIPATDPDNYDLKNLFDEGFSFDQIQKETLIYNQDQGNVWRQIVKREADAEVQKLKVLYQRRYEDWVAERSQDLSVFSDKQAEQALQGKTWPNILKVVLEKNKDEELLFRAKLAVFEMPEIKSKATKTTKQKMRTAKSFLDLFAVMSIIMADPLQEDVVEEVATPPTE